MDCRRIPHSTVKMLRPDSGLSTWKELFLPSRKSSTPPVSQKTRRGRHSPHFHPVCRSMETVCVHGSPDLGVKLNVYSSRPVSATPRQGRGDLPHSEQRRKRSGVTSYTLFLLVKRDSLYIGLRLLHCGEPAPDRDKNNPTTATILLKEYCSGQKRNGISIKETPGTGSVTEGRTRRGYFIHLPTTSSDPQPSRNCPASRAEAGKRW
jgi:hypothetical protein